MTICLVNQLNLFPGENFEVILAIDVKDFSIDPEQKKLLILVSAFSHL